jgi:dipeptidyl aminopeptidase/acylaminoacyl peptidase
LGYTERQIAFGNEGQRLYGFLHVPDGAGPHPAVALLHGFGGNHIEPHALFPKAARALAGAGVAALRFDFRGSGDSEGEFRDASIESEVSDTEAGLRWLAEQPEVDGTRLGLVGLSLGGMIAACAAGRNPAVRALVLWAPVAHLGELFEAGATAERTREIATQGVTDLGGLEVGAALVGQAMEIDPVAGLAGYAEPALIAHGTADAVVPTEHGRRYKAALGERAELELFEGADHVFSSVAWERRLIGLTVGWLREHL